MEEMRVSDIEGKAPKAFGASEWSGGDAGDIDGKTERPNGAFGKSDIEGKTATGSGEGAGERMSFKGPGGHESMWVTERVSNQEPMKKPTVAEVISFSATRRLRCYDGRS